MIERLSVALVCVFSIATHAAGDEPDVGELLRTAVSELIKMQEPDGDWPYEGVYRVRNQIPLGYRVGGTAIVIETLLFSGLGDEATDRAIGRGVEFILGKLDDPLLRPSTEDTYDVRVWAHCYALQTFCRLREKKRLGEHAAAIDGWIPKLIEALRIEQLDDGGWNYAGRRAHATFVTAPVVQALLLARSQRESVDEAVLSRATVALRRSRYGDGAFAYSGPARERAADSRPSSASAPASAPALSSAPSSRRADLLPGSIARSPACESTLLLLGAGSQRDVAAALDAFHTHWDELEKRRKKTGTHVPPYGVAPYYFYYGHRYAAQAIQMLPPEARQRERERLLEVILRTRDADGTWNDRVFERSRNFGTAMIVLALLGDAAPLPPALGD